jgi:hypothetical protein
VLHLPDQVAGKGAEVLLLGRIFGTDDEPEVMPVIIPDAALGEVAQIRLTRRRVEHPGGRAVPGHAPAPQIGEMFPNRASAAEALSDDAGLYDHPARKIAL